MSKTAARLGRGLSSIIGPTIAGAGSDAAVIGAAPALHGLPAFATAEGAAMQQLDISRITPNPAQPRRRFDPERLAELAASIRNSGVVQPILVRPRPDGVYELIAGERRWRAAQLAGLTRIPAVVREAEDAAALELALVENLQREDLGPLERALGYQGYLERFGVTTEQLARRLGESRANVSNYLRLLRLPQEIRDMIQAGQLAMGQARAVAGIDDPQRQLAVAHIASRRNLSVRQVEALATADPQTRSVSPPVRTLDTHMANVERRLSKALGMRVQLRPGRAKNSGRVIITYNSLEEFDTIAQRLGGSPLLE